MSRTRGRTLSVGSEGLTEDSDDDVEEEKEEDVGTWVTRN